MKEIGKRLTETIKFNFSFLRIYYEQYEFDWYLIIVIITFHNETAAEKERTDCLSERNQDKILYVILLFRDAKWIWRTLIGIISSRTEWDQDTDEKKESDEYEKLRNWLAFQSESQFASIKSMK